MSQLGAKFTGIRQSIADSPNVSVMKKKVEIGKMSINHLPAAALDIVSDMGWNEESVIIHLNGFIAEKDLEDELAEYLAVVADEEGGEVDESDGPDDIISDMGWNEDSLIVHYSGFLSENDQEEAFATYLRKIAGEEDGEADY